MKKTFFTLIVLCIALISNAQDQIRTASIRCKGTVSATGKPQLLSLTKSIQPKMDQQNGNSCQLTLLPNPASNFLFISLKDKENKLKNVRVLDVTGQLLIDKLATSDDIQKLNIYNLPSGIYFISTTTDAGELFSARFIKQ